ncbi:MAG: hypothetical protein DHS20C14_12030 [Phycisphaeraceae bacterium]|nr:MAG: hypothetical protein DHS20C14_12030 [Phycisphaeraceae bacterium]
MLKFIRKYQLFILVIGGSLLMVVFLLQPVLTKMAPSPGKRKGAEIGSTGTKITQIELSDAQRDVEAVGLMMPALLGANAVGIALDPVDKNQRHHWLLLAREAKAGGFVGGATDGFDWIPEIADMVAAQQSLSEMQQRRFRSEQEFLERQALLRQQYTTDFSSAIPLIAGRQQMTETQVGEALATARGIRRMLNTYARAPKPTRQQAVAEARDALDAVQFDFVRIPAGSFMDTSSEPSDTELQAFFDDYRADEPADNEYGFSYILQPRVKLAYLELDAPSIMAALVPDRIELNKRWRADRVTYPGEFNQEISQIDADWRAERAQALMYEGDQIIRAETRRRLRAFPEQDGVYTLPAGEMVVDYEEIAQVVAEELGRGAGVPIPLPTVRVITDRWRTSNDLRFEPDIGRALYRVGASQYSAAALPEMLALPASEAVFPIQTGVPIVDIAATDAQGSRFYVTALDFRERSAAHDIDEVGRDQVLRDYRTLKSYEALLGREDEILRVARETSGLSAVVDLLDPVETPADGSEPAARRIRVVRAARAVRDQLANTFDGAMNTPEVREAILAAGKKLDPMADSRDQDPRDTIMVLRLPGSQSLAAIKIVAPRPLTTDDFRAMGPLAISTETDQWLTQDDDFLADFPYTYEALTRKYDYTVTATSQDDEDAGADEETAAGEPDEEASTEG